MARWEDEKYFVLNYPCLKLFLINYRGKIVKPLIHAIFSSFSPILGG
jgi:hypothetical protein